jgi:uncharacterized membrane protein YsdA (DUF1294 family)
MFRHMLRRNRDIEVTLLLAAVPLLLAGLAVVQVDKKNARRAWRATTSILHSISVTVPQP